ncbi:hypothetical protein PsorP6_013302 [Peronosclerospora sorghi]|uniref:Uncharacterized protein n=1 Tax=Peronosclerospora sorghi TaxID=230839 RepID=A0ACC0WHG9_9STRA|nr:hypothetical protein PsorP6_013302 [Peronosclerospora sorghi]
MKSKTQFQDLIQRGQPVVADFIAPRCGKCAQIEPFVLSLAEAHPDVTFAKLDVSILEVEELNKELDVGAYPEFRFVKEGNQVHDKVLGYKKSFLNEKAVQTLAMPLKKTSSFNTSYVEKYGLRISARHPQAQKVFSVECRFCTAFERECKIGAKRKAT